MKEKRIEALFISHILINNLSLSILLLPVFFLLIIFSLEERQFIAYIGLFVHFKIIRKKIKMNYILKKIKKREN